MREIAIVLVISLILASLAFAGPNREAKIAVHVTAYNSKQKCTNLPSITSCHHIITTYPGTDVHFFPVWFDVVEYTAVQYGVTWEGGTCSFTNCADFIIGDIAYPGDGAAHAWTNCQPGPVCIPGFGWVTSYDLIRIVPHPTMGGPYIISCHNPQAYEDTIPLISLGYAGTNGLLGCQPCSLSVEPTTWGQIKALFR